MNETYSPFDKEIDDLDESELNKLIEKSISEGWYVEYKADLPKKSGKLDQSKIVKTISAFANTKGGWLFYGILTDEKNVAKALPGINISEYKNIADQISQVISGNITPKPIFHIKVVKLGQTDNYIIIIRIEESPIPPYITSQGIIYQRENNENNPIKDRYILERLAEKTDLYYSSIDNFCKIKYGETKGQSESNQSYLELYLFPLPFNDFRFKDFYSSDFFKLVAARFYQSVSCTFKDNEGEVNLSLNLGFNSIYSSEKSLVIRPLKDNNLIYKTTTAELFINGGFKFLIPLYEFDIQNVPPHFENSKVIDYLLDRYSPNETTYETDYFFGNHSNNPPREILKRKDTDFVRHIKMIDGAELIYVLMVITSIYKAILEDSGFDLKTDIGFRAQLTSIWRKFVFFDNEDYLDKIKLFNLPIAPKDNLEIPRFAKGNFYVLNLDEEYSFFTIAKIILEGIGLPDSSSIKFSNIIHDGVKRYSPQ